MRIGMGRDGPTSFRFVRIHLKRGVIRVIDGTSWLINGIRLLINGVIRLIHGTNRLMNWTYDIQIYLPVINGIVR